MIESKMKVRCGTFEGGICHVKIIQTFAEKSGGFLFYEKDKLYVK